MLSDTYIRPYQVLVALEQAGKHTLSGSHPAKECMCRQRLGQKSCVFCLQHVL